jgi:hypothetical protein
METRNEPNLYRKAHQHQGANFRQFTHYIHLIQFPGKAIFGWINNQIVYMIHTAWLGENRKIGTRTLPVI